MAAPQAITQTIEVGGKTLTLETGKLAKQADGAVVTPLGDTVVLSTAVTDRNVRDGQHFFPLTVDYRERFSAPGAFPGGFFKREARPTDKETLTSRLIDRTIRPALPGRLPQRSPGPQLRPRRRRGDRRRRHRRHRLVGRAVASRGSPFDGPTAHVRVGRVDGEFVLFPTASERAESDIDLIVAGKADAIAMVEGEMDEISEDDMVAALEFGFEAIQTIVAGITEFVGKRDEQDGAPEPLEYSTVAPDAGLVETVYGHIKDDVDAHLRSDYSKEAFYGGVREIRDNLVTKLFGEGDDKARRDRRRLHRRRRQGGVQGGRVPRDARDDPGRGPPPRRSQDRRDPRHLDRGRLPPQGARLGRVHARRDADARHGHARHRPGRPGRRPAVRPDGQAVLPPLQLPAVLGRRDQVPARPVAPRDRPRHARRARALEGDAGGGGVPLHGPHHLGRARVERLVVDGVGLWRLDGADGRRRPAGRSRSRASRWA